MKLFYTLVKIVILLAFVLLAVNNVHSTEFFYLPGLSLHLPLIVLLLLFFVVGAVFGVMAMFGRLLVLRNEAAKLRGSLKKTAQQPVSGSVSSDTQAH